MNRSLQLQWPFAKDRSCINREGRYAPIMPDLNGGQSTDYKQIRDAQATRPTSADLQRVLSPVDDGLDSK